jgi:hypothetical protein
MKDNFNKIVLSAVLILAAILMMSSCVSQAEYHPACPVCGECYASDEHLDAHCATNFEGVEAKFGAHDFFLKEDPSLVATKCLTCGIHFTHPSYGEHIKTCCP